jgi:hypothetical protein
MAANAPIDYVRQTSMAAPIDYVRLSPIDSSKSSSQFGRTAHQAKPPLLIRGTGDAYK